MRSSFILAMITGLLTFNAYAKRFASQYCEFELPPGWQCSLEGTEWVCQSLNKERKKEAIIILAAKIRGSQDSLDQYQAYLKNTKTFKLPGGKTQVSEAKYTKLSTINAHRWVDALHLASEVPGFYTRYLATVKEDLGVAVTFSVGKDFYNTYQSVFDQVVKTLRVFRQKNKALSNYKLKKKDEDLLGDVTYVPDGQLKSDISHKKRKSGGLFGLGENDWLILLVLLAGVGGFIAMKKKKKGKKSSKSSGGAKKKKKKKKVKKKVKKTTSDEE